MAAVKRQRRWWTWAVVAAWAVVLAGAVFWSVRNDPPTVPEQRDIGQALTALRGATGAVVEAVQDERWVLRIGELEIGECAITPVRDGLEAGRSVTLYVAEGEARAALTGVAEALPESFGAGVVASRGATRLSFFADAGDYIAIEATAHATDQVLTLRASTGCRPVVDDLDRSDPAAGPVPEVPEVLTGAVESRAVTCPGGGTAATFVAETPAQEAPGAGTDADRVPEGVELVWMEPGGLAYRRGSESVVVTTGGERTWTSVTTGCREGQ